MKSTKIGRTMNLEKIRDKVSSEMCDVIDLYSRAHSMNEIEYEQQADRLLEKILERLSFDVPVKLGDGLLGTACGIIYLLQHHYVKGDADEILSEIDNFLFYQLVSRSTETVSNWGDWLFYFRIRILCERKPDKKLLEIIFRQNLIFLLDRLSEAVRKGFTISGAIYSELERIHRMGIFPVRTAALLGLKRSRKCLIPIDRIEKEEVAFIVPLRIDSEEREQNLDFLLAGLTTLFPNSEILLMEGDSQPRYKMKYPYPQVCYQFVKDTDPIFYRTRYLNDALEKVDSPVVGIWDTDIWASKEQIQCAINAIVEEKAVMSLPYDGRCCYLSKTDSELFRTGTSYEVLDSYGIYMENTNGGAFLVNRKTYLSAGGENELFYGWGPEDMERIKRMEILGLPVFRSEGPLFHVYHPRNLNSVYAVEKIEKHNREVFLNVCSLSPNELRDRIQHYHCRSQMKNIIDSFQKNTKYKAEIAFWEDEIHQYLLWYEGRINRLHTTPAPPSEQRVVADTSIHSAILTWTQLHQQPKYLQELQLDTLAFSGKRVLDIGTGPIPSATCFSGCELYALDPLLSVYRNLGFPYGLYPEVHFIEAYAEQLPFEDNFFDVIISVNAIDHVDSLEQVGKELQRVGKPDCLFAMHVHYHSSTICEPIEINDALFKSVFSWVNGLRVVTRSHRSFSSVAQKGEQFVLWSNIV